MPRFDTVDNPIEHDNYDPVVRRSDDARTNGQVVGYAPADLANWDGEQDPGRIDGAVDQLASRMANSEAAITSHNHDADYAAVSHGHAASDLTSGTISDARIDAKYRRDARIFYLKTPTIGDAFVLAGAPVDSTINKVIHRCHGSPATVDFNIEARTMADPEAAGTNIWSSNQTATATKQSSTSFSNDSLNAEDLLVLAVSATAHSPTSLWVMVIVQKD